ncbi:dihydrofolate reductase [Sphingobium nicotianae]|uniref:Dihydrofolate reductase n=1 Tax=Sphingobium nicotianae TaxID=2782607 RepID=A0A9X1IS05_9SPHN|nr:dihydrofolate reductase [Sphingobium nicotianae]MBT2187963.1 dihydrofolate reductase [Sphingobium nicotianae]
MVAGRPEIVLLIARADNGVIGSDGGIPWRIPGEQRRFKAMTMGTPMVMGRKTFESFPRPLPGRRHIVLTRDGGLAREGAEVVHSVEDAVAIADAPVISVIGGAELYRLFEPIADRIELTQVHSYPMGDAFIASPDPARWRETAREDFPTLGDVPAYSYVTYLRA